MRTHEGNVAIITGASMGIDAAIAEELAREGARVALVARGRDALDAEAAKIGPSARSYPCDMSDPEAIAAMVADVERDLGPVDILINNVGAGTFSLLPHAAGRSSGSCPSTSWARQRRRPPSEP